MSSGRGTTGAGGYGRHGHRDDVAARGASLVEWGAALLVIAAIVAVLAAAGLPQLITEKTVQAICVVSQQEGCAKAPQDQEPAEPRRPPGSGPDREVRDGADGGEVARSEGDAGTGDAEVDNAYRFMGQVHDYFRDRFGRDSYDGRGARIVVEVRDPDTYSAAWSPSDRRIHFHDGRLALDIMGHEFTHALIESTAGLEYQGQSGALNESIADIFGSNIDPEDWEIGEDREGGPIRDMADPQRFDQPAHVDDYVDTEDDHGGVHTNSGIPNHAYYQMVQRIGRERAELIVYRAVTEHLDADSDFEDFRTASLTAAQQRYGEDSEEYRAVNEAFAEVGLDGTWEGP